MNTKLLTAVAIAASFAAGAATAGTLEDVQENGILKCAINSGFPGFSATDDVGNWKGFDVDYCHAIAAAVLGDGSKVDYKPVSAKNRFTILQSGEVDIVSRNTTWSVMRDTTQAVDYVGTMYYDGQGFIVREELGVASVNELSGASICLATASSTEQTLADYFRANNLEFRSVAFGSNSDARKGYVEGACDVFTGDQSAVAAALTTFKDAEAHMVLPEIISKEPLSPYVRQGDDKWGDVARWVRNALIAAEEFGITQDNVDETAANSTNPEIRRLLGAEGDIGDALGLSPDWAHKAIKTVGNYGEMWARNVEPLGLERGLNNLYTNGGLHYAPPFR